MRQELNQNGHMMDEYRRQFVARQIKAETESLASSIIVGALNEQAGEINRLEMARAKNAKAAADELKRWDPVKLNAERQNLWAQVDAVMANKSSSVSGRSQKDALASIASEAKARGDIHALRAAYEVFSAVKTSGETSYAVAGLRGDLEQSLAAARITPAMQSAASEVESAKVSLLQCQAGLPAIAASIGEDVRSPFSPSSIARAMKKVQVIDGDVQIFSDDSPEVCGWVILPDSVAAGG